MKTPSQKAPAEKPLNAAKETLYPDLNESEALELNEPLVSYVRLDPAAHGRVICNELTAEEEALANDPNVKPFSHIGDSAEYVRRIRRDFRC